MEVFHLNNSKNLKLSELSGGMLQKVGIINALIGDPKIIVLDEPANGLDPAERTNLRNILATLAKDKIIIYSTHIIADVDHVASRIVAVKKGQVIYDGNKLDMLGLVKEKVWEFKVANQAQIRREHFVVNIKHIGNQLIIRVVSTNKPEPNAMQVNPTLEDAYLYISGNGKEVRYEK